jgi:SLT domain-containing protein
LPSVNKINHPQKKKKKREKWTRGKDLSPEATRAKNKGNMNKSSTQNPQVARSMSNKERRRTPKGNT